MKMTILVFMITAVLALSTGATCLNMAADQEPRVTFDDDGNTFIEGLAVSIEEYMKYVDTGEIPERVYKVMIKKGTDAAVNVLGLPSLVSDIAAGLLALGAGYYLNRTRRERKERIKLGMVIEETKPNAPSAVNAALDKYLVTDTKFYEQEIKPKETV